MTSARARRRRHRRAMMRPRRRRYTIARFGVFPAPAETITHHEIPKMTDHGNVSQDA